MSRTLQYIGLNKYARDFVKGAIKVEDAQPLYDIWGEEIIGKRYYMPTPSGPNKEMYFEEVMQCAPWSSGPMVFTCLKQILIKECGHIIENDGFFQWMLDPNVEGEVDEQSGRYYV